MESVFPAVQWYKSICPTVHCLSNCLFVQLSDGWIAYYQLSKLWMMSTAVILLDNAIKSSQPLNNALSSCNMASECISRCSNIIKWCVQSLDSDMSNCVIIEKFILNCPKTNCLLSSKFQSENTA